MYSVSYLKRQQRSYKDKLEEAKQSYRKNEDEYESLLEFKRLVERSQNTFHTTQSSKKRILEDVASVKANCLAAKRYYMGMCGIFDGIGAKIVAGVYTVLLNGIRNKLTQYRSAAERCEERIEVYREKLIELDEQIEEAAALAAANDLAL